jgi:hypothetical protein
MAAVIDALSGVPLTSLMTNSNGIRGDLAAQLARAVLAHPTLEHFGGVPMRELRTDSVGNVIDCDEHATALELSANSQGQPLDLSGKALGAAESLVLAQLLEHAPSLSRCDVTCNADLSVEGEQQLTEAVKQLNVQESRSRRRRSDGEEAHFLLLVTDSDPDGLGVPDSDAPVLRYAGQT